MVSCGQEHAIVANDSHDHYTGQHDSNNFTRVWPFRLLQPRRKMTIGLPHALAPDNSTVLRKLGTPRDDKQAVALANQAAANSLQGQEHIAAGDAGVRRDPADPRTLSSILLSEAGSGSSRCKALRTGRLLHPPLPVIIQNLQRRGGRATGQNDAGIGVGGLGRDRHGLGAIHKGIVHREDVHRS